MDLRKALQEFGSTTKKKLQGAVPVATGKTKQSIRYRTTSNSVTLFQDGGWFGALIEGRAPRRVSTDMGFAGALLKWMQAVGGAGGIPTTKAGAGRLAYLINKYGTRLHQKKTTSTLEGLNFDSEIEKLRSTLGDEIMKSIKLDLLKITKQ